MARRNQRRSLAYQGNYPLNQPPTLFCLRTAKGEAVSKGSLIFIPALKMGAKCFVFSEGFSALVTPIFIDLRASQSDMTTQFISKSAAAGRPTSIRVARQ